MIKNIIDDNKMDITPLPPSQKKCKKNLKGETLLDIKVGDKVALSRYYKDFLSKEEATTLYNTLEGLLTSEGVFTQDKYVIFGKTVDAPRLTATFGPEGITYKYAGMVRKPTTTWPTCLKECKDKIEESLGCSLNYAFVNYYKTDHYIGWHSDSEGDIETTDDGQTTICSISVGDEREFRLRQIYKAGKEPPTKVYKKVLENGSLCTMEKHTQSLCKHSVPVKNKATTPRINITFRLMKTGAFKKQ